MTPLDRLLTLEEARLKPSATPKDALETKLDRAIDNKAARLLDAKQLRAWAREVKALDHWKDRKTGRRVLSTLNLDPDRAEAHHVVGKDDWAVRYDVRNGITLSLATHLAVETGKLRIEGTVFFTVRGQRYINAREPVIFVRL
jgi:hypothetical protein